MLKKLEELEKNGVFCYESFAEYKGLPKKYVSKIKKLVITNGDELQPYTFSELKSVEDVVFVDYNKNIPMGCFSHCTNLKNVSGCEDVSEIADHAFAYCNNLKHVDNLVEIERVGDRAFYNCENLQKISLGSKTKAICEHAFENCASLKELDIKATVTDMRIKKNILVGCKNIDKIVLNKKSYYYFVDNKDRMLNADFNVFGIDNSKFMECLHTRDTNRYKHWHKQIEL